MPNLTLPHPSLLASLSQGEAAVWVREYGLPATADDLAAFGMLMASQWAEVRDQAARDRMAKRRRMA